MTSTTVAPAKPPRQVVKDETVTETDDIVNVINEEEEDDLEGHEDHVANDTFEKQDEPKQITVQIEEQSRRPRRDKNLFESKSMTNLKQERLSMKRRHRFSGDKCYFHY